MFPILCALVLDVPAAAECLLNFQGVSPNVLLAFEPWDHIDHMGVECHQPGYGSGPVNQPTAVYFVIWDDLYTGPVRKCTGVSGPGAKA